MARYLTQWQPIGALGTLIALAFLAASEIQTAAFADDVQSTPYAVPASPEKAAPRAKPRPVINLAKPESPQQEPTEFAPQDIAQWADEAKTDTWREEPQDAQSQVEVVRERYPNRTVKIEREVKQDAEGNYINHGIWKMWNARGAIVAQGQYKEGARDGLWHRWHGASDSKLFQRLPYQQYPGPFISQATFDAGQIDGTWIIYDSKQRKISQWHYKSGVRHGPSTWWYPNGKVMQEVNYTHGDLDGKLRQYNIKGELVREDTYQLGRKLAPKVTYYRDGKQKKTEGMYLFAKIIDKGNDDWWNAAPAANTTVGVDERHGPWIAWYANGQKQVEGNYKNDLEVGSFVWWYPNGQKSSEGSYADGRPHGTWVWWHQNGQKSAQGQYTRGQLAGLWNSWDKAGKLTRAEDHAGGTRLRTAEQPDLPPSGDRK